MSDGPLGSILSFLSKTFGKSPISQTESGRKTAPALKPAANHQQHTTTARGYYVYVHTDEHGDIFYVGKGKGQRAWSTNRHDVWGRYVNERLGGIYIIKIVRDGLTEDQAINAEASLIDRYGGQLINWDNPGRGFDYEAIARFHKLRNENRRFVAETRPLELSDPEQAVIRYRQALLSMFEYESIVMERGLVAELTTNLKDGDLNILDRITICLQRLGKTQEMVDEVDRYFARFPPARERSAGKRIQARVDKVRAQLNIK